MTSTPTEYSLTVTTGYIYIASKKFSQSNIKQKKIQMTLAYDYAQLVTAKKENEFNITVTNMIASKYTNVTFRQTMLKTGKAF